MNNNRRSRSGARILGDDYQHLVAWCWALRAILPNSLVETLAVEAIDAGAVDDVVLIKSVPPHEYLQVKGSVDASTPVSTAWLLEIQGRSGKSLLKRFYESWIHLEGFRGLLDMQLVTNRNIDPGDSLLVRKDGRSDLLIPAAARVGPDSRAGQVLISWAEHLEINVEKLLAMLQHLKFYTGRSYGQEITHAESLMLANGLRADEQAITLGVALVRGWVVEGVRKLARDDIQAQIEDLDIRQEAPQALLVIQAIDRDLHPEDATIAIDWLDLFKGGSPAERRVPDDPAAWERMASDLHNTAEEIRAMGIRRVFVRGAMRLATWFAVGSEFRKVMSMEVGCQQGTSVWTSDTRAGPTPGSELREFEIGAGPDLAVAIGISADLVAEVEEYVRKSGATMGRLLCLLPEGGPHDQAIRDARDAVAVVQEARNIIRDYVVRMNYPRVHLFMATPAGIALLLGHRWNRLVPTVVYEDCGPNQGYEPAFFIAG